MTEFQHFDKGPWERGRTNDGRLYLQSDDFMFDVRLYISGDFPRGVDDEYADALAKALNALAIEAPSGGETGTLTRPKARARVAERQRPKGAPDEIPIHQRLLPTRKSVWIRTVYPNWKESDFALA